ncbi:MAG: diacylglycerol/lipid kinase family protein [Patescibacteria group bacterium]
MYLYLFDSFLAKKKYKKILDRIETRITDLEISGRIIRLTILENIQEIVRDALKKGVETFIAVGNDRTLCETATSLMGSEATVGFIPIGERTKLARILGLPKEEMACEVISARLTEEIDLAKVNNYFFLSSIKINNPKIIISSDNYKIYLSQKINEVRISNLDEVSKRFANPKDGFLEVNLYRPSSSFFSFLKLSKEKIVDSVFFLKKLKIESLKRKKEIPALIDNWRILKTPLEIEITPYKLKVIVGKERYF